MAFPVAALAAAAPIVGDAINYAANERTNYYNTLQTREANAQNERLFHESLQWNEDMYNMYQTYPAKVNQLREAGLNPNLMLGSGTGASVGSVTQPQMQSSQSVPFQSQGFHLLGSALADNELKKSQADLIQSQTDAQNIDNLYKSIEHVSNLQEQLSRTKKNSAEYDNLLKEIELARINIQYQADYNKARNEDMRASAELKRNQSVLAHNQATYQELITKAFPERNEAELAEINAHIYEMIQSGLASGASIAVMKEQAANYFADTLLKNDVHTLNAPAVSSSNHESYSRSRHPRLNRVMSALDALFNRVRVGFSLNR